MAVDTKRDAGGFKIAARHLAKAVNASKCWACNCLGSTLKTIEKAVPEQTRIPELQEAVDAAGMRLQPPATDCRGCKVCFPVEALNALSEVADQKALEAATCPAEEVSPRDGWPPLPGDYTVLGYRRPVVICTLHSDDLRDALVKARPEHVSAVGTLHTENLGIERLISNVVANPHIRFLILCGMDAQQKIGHFPGQSLAALSENGLGKRSRIIGAKGKRPVLRNIDPELIDHFRRNVEIIDMIGSRSTDELLAAASELAKTSPGPSAPLDSIRPVQPLIGYVPHRMVSDPNGYFVVYPDHQRKVISLEHYSIKGVLTTLIEGKTAVELYHPVIESKLISRLDHACYLGRELAKAEQALLTGQKYVQDAAPEPSTAVSSGGCSNGCEKDKI